MHKVAIATLVALLAAAIPNEARAQDAALQARFDTLIETGLKQDPLPGIAVGIVRHGRVVYARGFGVMKLGHPDEPITPRTLFHMASITKTFVATAVMQLWEQGRVDLDAPVVRYLPDFRIDDPRYRRITVREMLSHSSGMPDVEDYDWEHPRLDGGALDRYVRGLAGGHLRLLFDPGTGMAYSNMAYEVLGDLVAKVSGVTFEDYVQANILRPAGMTSSTLLLRDADPALLASGYMRPRGGGYASLRPVAAYPYNREHGPSSDLMSSVDDMLRWALINLNLGELDGRRILKRSTYEELWKPAVEVEFCRAGDRSACRKPGAWVGISWFIETKDGHPLISHSGGDDGFMTDLVLAPDADMGLVLMTNALAGGTTLPQEIVRAFYDITLRDSDDGAAPRGRAYSPHPDTANQAPVGEVTKITGPRQRAGTPASCWSIVASPSAEAGAGSD